MNFRNSAASAASASAAPTNHPPPHPKGLTLADLASGQTEHAFNVGAARDALLYIPVSFIQRVQSFLDGTGTPDQTTQTYQDLSDFAKAYEVGLAFHNSAKKADVAVTDGGTVYTQSGEGNGTMTQVFPSIRPQPPNPHQSTGDSDDAEDERARVAAYADSGPAMIEAADTDVTNTGLAADPIPGHPPNGPGETESTYVPKKKSGKVYASTDPFNVKHRHPGNGMKQPTTTQYSHVVTRLPHTIGGGYLLAAKRK
jgi:hypothetical protein